MSIKKNLLLSAILFTALFGLTKNSLASNGTYYVCDTGSTCGTGWTTGSDSNNCTQSANKNTPKKTIRGAISCMSGTGNTVVIGDGTYTGTNNMMGSDVGGNPWSGIPSGSAGSYNKVMAEHYLGATIDANGASTHYAPVWITGSYIQIEGIHAKNSAGGNFMVMYGDHIKFISDASEEAAGGHFYFSASQYCLVEDSFGWGRVSYAFWNGDSAGKYNVFRRCVVRKDAHAYMGSAAQTNWYGSFVAYHGTDTYFQNSISIDSETRRGYIPGDGSTDADTSYDGVIFTANGNSTNFHVDGSLSVNDADSYILWPDEYGSSYYINNFAAIAHSTNTKGIYSYSYPGYINNTYLTNLLVKNTSAGIYNAIHDSLINSILTSNTIGMSGSSLTHTYNTYYNTTDLSSSGSFGAGELRHATTATDGLKYPVRVEDGSYLKTAGSGGAQVGPEILNRIGRNTATSYGNPISGLLYGETGWDELQDGQSGRALARLWPYPNEDVIKAKMATYNLHGANGARGFATGTSKDGSPQTLTKYIWEYLGNQIPADVYGGSGDTTAPSAPSGLSVN